MQNKFQKFQKMPLILSILLLAFSCFLFLVLYREIQNNSKISEQAQTVWQDEVNRRNELNSLDSLLKTTEPERILLDSHFIESSDVVPFLDMFDKLAGAVGAKAEVTSVVIALDNSGLLVTIKATGLFESLDKFLMLLENSSYELDFVSVDIQKSDVGVVSDKNIPSSQWSAVFVIKLLSFIK